MTKEEALQQIEEYKKPLDRSTATFGNIVDDYYTTSEVLEITRGQIVTSLRKKGLPLSEGAKLSEVPSEILKLPTMERKLEIVPPNPGAVIDKFDGEFNVTNINANYSPDSASVGSSLSYNNRGSIHTENYIVFFSASRVLNCFRFDGGTGKAFQVPQYDTNNICWSGYGDVLYVFVVANSTSVNCHVYDLSDTDLTSPKETHVISSCYDIAWCKVIDGTMYLAYNEQQNNPYRFGTYNVGDTTVTKKIDINESNINNVIYDDKYFYFITGTRYVRHVNRNLSVSSLKSIQLSLSNNPTCVTVIGDKILANYGSNGMSLFHGPDHATPGFRLTSLLSSYTDYNVVLDDTHFIVSYNSSPYTRLLRLDYDSLTDKYSVHLVFSFNDINTSTMSYPSMEIAKDSTGKMYLAQGRYRNYFIQGINAEYEFDLERRV